jgi:hypothetical protein
MMILEPDGSMTTPVSHEAHERPIDTMGSEIAEVVMQRVAQRLGEIESSIAARIDALHIPAAPIAHSL